MAGRAGALKRVRGVGKLLRLLDTRSLLRVAAACGVTPSLPLSVEDVVVSVANSPGATVHGIVHGVLARRELATVCERLGLPRRGTRAALATRVVADLELGRFLSFERAQALVREVGVKSFKDYHAWSRGDLPGKGRRPSDVPSNPATVYLGHGWTSWGDFLGTGNLSGRERGKRLCSYERARRWASALGIHGVAEWRAFLRGEYPDKPRLPDDVPMAPDGVFGRKGLWKGWADFLGTDGKRRQARRQYLPFEEAKRFVSALGLEGHEGWLRWSRGDDRERGPRPAEVPGNPPAAYPQEWRGWSDFLGTGRPPLRRAWPAFAEARAFARALGLRTAKQWLAWCRGEVEGLPRRPSNVPAAPYRVYETAWQGWDDWLGTGRVVVECPRPFRSARRFVRDLGLKSEAEWRAYRRGERPDLPPFPADLPRGPERTYAGRGWVCWGDWLGTGRPRRRDSGQARGPRRAR